MKHLHVRPPPKFSLYNDIPRPPLEEDEVPRTIQPRKKEIQKNPYNLYLQPIQETIPPHNDFNRKFLDLLKKIFVYDPKKRITAHQALQHEWFREHFEDDGTEAEKIRFERERAERLKRVPAGPR